MFIFLVVNEDQHDFVLQEIKHRVVRTPLE